MAIKQRKPINASSRFQTYLGFEEITRDTPEKSLTEGKKKTGGRNNRGQLTSWWRGGGHKQRYRVIDFKRNKTGVPATVASIEYDPNRTCRIALLNYADGTKSYILAPDNLEVGARVICEIDPEYAQAWAGLADSLCELLMWRLEVAHTGALEEAKSAKSDDEKKSAIRSILEP